MASFFLLTLIVLMAALLVYSLLVKRGQAFSHDQSSNHYKGDASHYVNQSALNLESNQHQFAIGGREMSVETQELEHEVSETPKPKSADNPGQCESAEKVGCKCFTPEQIANIIETCASREGLLSEQDQRFNVATYLRERMTAMDWSPCVASGSVCLRVHLGLNSDLPIEDALLLYSFATGPHGALHSGFARAKAGKMHEDQQTCYRFRNELLSSSANDVLSILANEPREVQESFRFVLGALGWLAKYENYAETQSPDWIKLLHPHHMYRLTVGAEALLMGSSLSELNESVRSVGPILNELDDYSCLIPNKPTQQGDPRLRWRSIKGMLVINGYLSVVGEKAAEGELGLVSDDDLSLIATLAYGYSGGAILPGFSLEMTGKHYSEAFLKEKVFFPPFMAKTDFGQSMYLGDYLMKSLVGSSGCQSLADATWSSAMLEEPKAYEIKLPDDFEAKEVEDCDHARVCWKLNKMDVESFPVETAEGMALYFGALDPQLYIESSYIAILPDGSEDRTRYMDDPETEHGWKAKFISDNFVAAGQCFPVFERLRQLMAATKLLATMREEKVPLHPELQHTLEKNMAELLTVKTSTEYHPMPFLPYRFDYVGGVTIPDEKSTVRYRAATASDMPAETSQALKEIQQSKTTDRLEAARFGSAFHAMEAEAYRKARDGDVNAYVSKDLRILSVNETMGGTARPDVVKVIESEDGSRKVVFVDDTYTGTKFERGHESYSHFRKGMGYMNEEEIKKLREKGYEYGYGSANPRVLH